MISKLDVIWANIRILPVRIAKAECCRLRHAIANKCFADVTPAKIGGYRIACVADMPASPDIIRMQNIEPEQFVGAIFFCNAAMTLRGEKILPVFGGKAVLLRKCVSRFHDLVPNRNHSGEVVFLIFSYSNSVHFQPRAFATSAMIFAVPSTPSTDESSERS